MPQPTRSTLTVWLAFAISASLSARTYAEEDPELAALMALLDTETEIATQSRMNADYVPGMVTILHAEDLKQLGIASVLEALNQVAGFHSTVNNVGDGLVIVRGVGATLNASNLKLLLDGVPVNRAADASADWLMRLPVNQIDRIEVIRGPGSAVRGEFAFSGVVNVISRKANAIAAKAGSFNFGQVDGHLSHQWKNGASMQLNAATWSRDNSGLITNQDNFAGRDLGHSPNTVYDHEEGQVLQTALDYLGYQLQVHYAALERGPAYGKVAAMPMEFEPRKETVTNISLNKSWQPSDSLQLNLALASQDTRLDRATALIVPAGITFPPGSPPAAQDRYQQDGNRDQTQRAQASLRWDGLANHILYTELGYAHYKIDEVFVASFSPGLPTTVTSAPQAGSERNLSSITVQDQWQLTDAWKITYGARYDSYDNWGDHLSPRVAAVWQLNDQHILKAQYAEAFRPPTLSEIHAGPTPGSISPAGAHLKEELLKSAELSWIFRDGSTVVRTTLFHTQVEDLIESFIQPGRPPIWRNLANIDSYGLEVEWQHRLGRDWQWHTNVSYVRAEDHLDRDEKLLGAINWLANIGLVWHSGDNSHHALRWRYVGEQEGWEIRTQLPQTERFDAYTSLDYSFALNNMLDVSGLQLSAGVKNLTGEEYNSVPTPAQFPQGLPHGKRTVWLQLEYEL